MGKQIIFASLIFIFSAQAHEVYPNLSEGDMYRAVNWIRDVSNPGHTAAPSAWTRESRVGDTLYIDGEIQPLQWSMLRDGEYKGVKRIVINSYGGLVEGAKEMATVIREQGLTTVVPAGGVCMSACTLIFQAGVKRQAHVSAIFMYHAPRASQIGMIKYYDLCKKEGKSVCEALLKEWVHSAPEEAKEFFKEYTKYDINHRFIQDYFDLPNEPEEEWMKDGNFSKKVDLYFSDSEDDPRMDKRYEGSIVVPLKTLEDYNIVTHWFVNDPGWRTDRSVTWDGTYIGP